MPLAQDSVERVLVLVRHFAAAADQAPTIDSPRVSKLDGARVHRANSSVADQLKPSPVVLVLCQLELRRVFAPNHLTHAGKTLRLMVSAAIGGDFVQGSAGDARMQWRSVADSLPRKLPRLGVLM